jgi:hypothetical protein
MACLTAHMWLNLSASRATEAEDRDLAAKNRDDVEQLVQTRTQISRDRADATSTGHTLDLIVVNSTM